MLKLGIEHTLRGAAMKRIVAALVLALACLPALAEEGLRVVYETTLTLVPTEGAETKVERETMTALLTPTAMLVRRKQEVVYDFAARRIYDIDPDAGASRAYSLFAVPGFHEREIVNREYMNRVTAALGMGRDVDMVDVESQFSMTAEKPAKVKLKERKQGDARVFELNGRDAVVLVPSATMIPESLRGAFSRLVIHQGAIHPRVRERILADGRLPQRLEFRWREIGRRGAVVWELIESAVEDVDIPAELAKYPPKPGAEGALMPLAWRVRHGEAGTARTAAGYQERVRTLLGEGRRLEALLVAFESSYATGTVDDALLKTVVDAAAGDPQAQAVRRAAEIEAREGDAKEALALLDSVSPEGLEGAPAIHVMRAMQRIRAGQADHALEDFGRALAINPMMVGPWLDAGRLYYFSYRMISAWDCWEAARAVDPLNPALKDIDQLEASLLRKHPEFF